jgi:hypothetical protein
MQRWQSFVDGGGLARYAAGRNDAAIAGVSRMSAYLHYGMVSPFRIAREAHEAGADKFLDELLIWRELAFNFCFHRADHQSWDAVPAWAQETLQRHAVDPRQDHCSWERLARGQTGDRLWDACQRSLIKHGELHNNVRMTWGKAFLSWVRTPQRALQLAIDLNHRFALDGRAPTSFGGLLWLFGQFDRPFTPEQAIYGTVRVRSTEEHARRLDLDQFERRVDRPIASTLPRIAVVGAGLAGLIAARTLTDQGLFVRVFEKSRGVGGRLATRRADPHWQFDHGAQYFTARDPRFQRYACSWLEDGIVQPWTGRVVQLRAGQVAAEKSDTARYVGVPSMNAIAKRLANDLSIVAESRVARMGQTAQGWQLESDEGRDLGDYDLVLLNPPPPQASSLLPETHRFQEILRSVHWSPCWAVMLAWDRSLELPFDAAFVDDSPLAWIANNRTKPGREPLGDAWVLHASSQWSEAKLECSPQEVVKSLSDAFADAVGLREVPQPQLCAAHRWRYAKPDPIAQTHLWDPESGVGLCGDWCNGPRVEGAVLSGMALAGAVLRHVTLPGPHAP